MLLDIRAYIKKQRQVSMQALVVRFDSDPEHIRDILRHFLVKGQLICLQKTIKCGVNCTRCSPLSTEIYQWVDTSSGNKILH